MAAIARTILKKVELESYITRAYLDKSFNRSGLCAYCSRKVTCNLNSSYGLVYDCEDYDAGDEASDRIPETEKSGAVQRNRGSADMNQYPQPYYIYYPAEYQVQQWQGLIGTLMGVAMLVAMGAWALSQVKKAVKGEEVKYPL